MPFRQRDGRDAACVQLRALGQSRGDTVAALAPGALRCPTALVLGEHDPFLNAARSERLVGWLRTATGNTVDVHTLPGVAHVAPEEAPDRLGTLVGELIAR
jgi:pimeloyl-ACP methyl ester carboxylesterase